MTDRKNRLWNAKAADLEAVNVHVTGKQLSQWYLKMCAIARNKMEPLPSGTGRDQMSAEKRRKHDLKKKLEWLTPFTVRGAGETPTKMRKALASRPPTPRVTVGLSPTTEQEGPPFTSTPSTSQGPAPGPSGHPRKQLSQTASSSRSSKGTPPNLQTLGQQMKAYENQLEAILANLHTTVMPAEVRGRKMFLESMYLEVLQKLPERMWAQFQTDYMKLVGNYRQRLLQSFDEEARS